MTTCLPLNLVLRMAAILVVVCFADAMVPIFPWVSIVPALIPVLTAIFVIRPLLQADAMRPGPVQPPV